MSGTQPARPARRSILGVLAVVSATLVVLVSCQSAGPPRAVPSSPAGRLGTPRAALHRARGRGARDHPRRKSTTTISTRRAARGEADGGVGGGVTVFDEESPAVTNLHPDLLRALRQAATDAAAYGVEIVVNSGWRSPEYQERLLRQAVSKYGSEENAARWVATAATSAHVSGHAVDIGPSRATAWLSKHGADYRLCQIYRNEPWHYELRADAVDDGCPPMYADPRHDPRMHQ